MEIFYDQPSHRLICLKTAAETWDKYWERAEIEKVAQHPPKQRFLCWQTQQYCKSHAKILEGGCGIGSTVLALHNAGFDAYGIDSARETVALSQEYWPHLKITPGDVRSLPFAESFFDGYWSLGVIEHFYNGYTEIINEMTRVIRPGGILFLTFPAFTRLRQMKAKRQRYPAFAETAEQRDRFWQFILDPEQVIRTFERHNFRLLRKRGQYSLVGLQKEWPPFRRIAKLLSRLPFSGWVKLNMLADLMIGNFSGHTCLCIFENRKEP